MAASLIDLVREDARQQRTGDTHFLEKNVYAFVLRGPRNKGSLGPQGVAVFPLPLNPQDFNYSLPFAAEVSPLQQSGVVAEEAGIVLGDIQINASMGFEPKPDLSTAKGAGDGEFTGNLGAGGLNFQDISGQLHFWRLANRCFDAYSALKKNPETAHQTLMEFHNLKEELHLTVIPRDFALSRNALLDRVSYRFSCRLTVVGPAQEITVVSPDKDLLDKIKDGIRTIRNSIQMLSATVDDLTAVMDEISRLISSVPSMIRDAVGIINSFTDFINGTKTFLDIPRQTLLALTEQAESVANAAAAIAGFPADAVQAFMDMSDQYDALIVASTDYLTESWDQQIDRYQRLTNTAPLTTGTKDYQLAETPGKGPTTFSLADTFDSSSERPGDVRRSEHAFSEHRTGSQNVRSVMEQVIGAGDTLQSLAAKYLGDARRWLDLAIVNQLEPPYIVDQACIPNTLRISDKILIPVSAPAPSPDTITLGDTAAGSSQVEQALGTDFFLKYSDDRKTYGWAIDTAAGSTDVIRIQGIANFTQALKMRFQSEQGQNILYPAIGLPRAIGSKGIRDPLSTVRYQVRQQLLADKRTERVVQFSLEIENDALILNADIQPIGYHSARTVKVLLT